MPDSTGMLADRGSTGALGILDSTGTLADKSSVDQCCSKFNQRKFTLFWPLGRPVKPIVREIKKLNIVKTTIGDKKHKLQKLKLKR
jgi:hypothetical protein